MPENVKFNIHCIYSLFEECRPYVLISDVMASIRKEKIESEKVPQRTHLTFIFIHITFQKGFSLKPLSISTKYNQPIYYEDAPVSCRLCLMMGGGVLIKICSKAVRSHLHF